MSLEVRADFLFGWYQGHSRAGELEDVPSLERLHAALLAGACSLERQEGKHPDEGIDSLDKDLFAWLEAHSPDAILLPEAMPQQSRAVAFRNKGGLKKGADAPKKECVASARSFLDGAICWYWDSMPTDAIIRRLGDIANEVPYLGESESCVIISVTEVRGIPQSALRACPPSFDARTFFAPDKGFTDELVRFFSQRQRKVKRDKTSKNEGEQSLQFDFSCLRNVYYARGDKEEQLAPVPWQHGYALKVLGRRIVREDYVAVSVCLHRALVSMFGDDLPKALRYAHLKPLANGLGIQVISANAPSNCLSSDDGMDSLLVMLPYGTSAEDEQLIANGLSRITRLYGKRMGSIDVAFTGERLDLNAFWDPAPQGVKRIFATEPLFIPDSRPPSRVKNNGIRWTVDDDARIAFGHVWRDLGFAMKSKGDQGRIDLSNAVSQSGIAVGGGRVVPTGNIRNYVHHTNRGAFLVAEWALVDMAALDHDRCLCAIGQTRHVGGGLLVPVDIPGLDGLVSGKGANER